MSSFVVSLRGRRKKGRGRGEGEREKGRESSSSSPDFCLLSVSFSTGYLGRHATLLLVGKERCKTTAARETTVRLQETGQNYRPIDPSLCGDWWCLSEP